MRLPLLFVLLSIASTAAVADLAKVKDGAAFMQLVEGKTLTRPLVKLVVETNGEISGVGVRWDVSGNWSWRDGYFCRDLFWGGDELGYNCQEVRADGKRIRFTSDKGQGRSAVFRLE